MLIIIFMKIIPPFLADFFNFFPFSETQMVTAGMPGNEAWGTCSSEQKEESPCADCPGHPKISSDWRIPWWMAWSLAPKMANFRIRYVKFHAKEWVLFLDPVFRDIIPGTIDVHGRPAREGWGWDEARWPCDFTFHSDFHLAGGFEISWLSHLTELGRGCRRYVVFKDGWHQSNQYSVSGFLYIAT